MRAGVGRASERRNDLLALAAADTSHLQPIPDILGDAQMRPQRVQLWNTMPSLRLCGGTAICRADRQ